MRKLTMAILSLAALAAVVYFGLPHFVWPPGGSSAGKVNQCRNHVRQLAWALDDYAAGNGGARPESLEALVQWHKEYGGSVPRCPFHNSAEHSYAYFPPDQLALDPDGKQVILCCRAPHPETVYSADGERSAGVVPVVRPNLTTEFIPVGEFRLTVEDEAINQARQPTQLKIIGISELTKSMPELVLRDNVTVRRALMYLTDFAKRETHESQPAEDHVPDYRVLLTMSDEKEIEILVHRFSWEWSGKWFPLKKGWSAFVDQQRTSVAVDIPLSEVSALGFTGADESFPAPIIKAHRTYTGKLIQVTGILQQRGVPAALGSHANVNLHQPEDPRKVFLVPLVGMIPAAHGKPCRVTGYIVKQGERIVVDVVSGEILE